MLKNSDLSHFGEGLGIVEGLTDLEDLRIEDCKEVRLLRLEKLRGLKRLSIHSLGGACKPYDAILNIWK